MKQRALYIEDDPLYQLLVVESLTDLHVTVANSFKEAHEELKSDNFDTIIIDLELPDGDGLKFLAFLAHDNIYKNIPILIVSGHTEISNKLIAFSLGVEDFIAKPFDPLELNARVMAKLRKKNQVSSQKRISRVGEIEIDFDRQKAFRVSNGKHFELMLTTIEFKILTYLSKRPEQVFSREQILNNVWGDTVISERTVDSHVAHLRQKLQETNIQLESVFGSGYRAVIAELPINH
jgi:DNA-binding response OmpR family regulator